MYLSSLDGLRNVHRIKADFLHSFFGAITRKIEKVEFSPQLRGKTHF